MSILNITDYINDKNLKILKKDIGEERFFHSMGVMEVCKKLALNYDVDENKAMLAGMFHDCGKFIVKENAYIFIKDHKIELEDETLNNYQLLHPALGYYVGKIKYGIPNEEVLNSIFYHTTLRENPTILDKIVYIGDAIEPNRDYDGVEYFRKLAFEDIDLAVLESLEKTLIDLIDKKKHIGSKSIESRNWLLKRIKQNK